MEKATITDIMTTGYAEIALWEGDGPGKQRSIAESPKYLKAKRGDVVEVEPIDSQTTRMAKFLYLLVPVFFILGFFVSRDQTTGDRILAGAIVAFMAFVICWIMNRRSRMINRQQYLVTRIIERKRDF